jgi:competence protein ComFC
MHREMRYLWDYSDQKAQDFIKTMKYMPSRKLCIMAGYLMAENLLETFSYQDWDLIIPVPLSNASLKKRGFNQCELIAKAIISKDYKLSNFSVKRIKNIKNQASVPHRKRLNNIKNIFYANSKKVSNKSILIIDDVITTGATINALTKSLLDAGASFVDVVALARSQAWIEYQWLARKALTQA